MRVSRLSSSIMVLSVLRDGIEMYIVDALLYIPVNQHDLMIKPLLSPIPYHLA
jgi:hypothetical protein